MQRLQHAHHRPPHRGQHLLQQLHGRIFAPLKRQLNLGPLTAHPRQLRPLKRQLAVHAPPSRLLAQMADVRAQPLPASLPRLDHIPLQQVRHRRLTDAHQLPKLGLGHDAGQVNGGAHAFDCKGFSRAKKTPGLCFLRAQLAALGGQLATLPNHARPACHLGQALSAPSPTPDRSQTAPYAETAPPHPLVAQSAQSPAGAHTPRAW